MKLAYGSVVASIIFCFAASALPTHAVDATKAKAVKCLLYKMNNKFLGDENIYISDEAVRMETKMGNWVAIARAPVWKLATFNEQSKMMCWNIECHFFGRVMRDANDVKTMQGKPRPSKVIVGGVHTIKYMELLGNTTIEVWPMPSTTYLRRLAR